MIDQNTVVRVRYGQGQEVNLGKLSIFEYTAPQSEGRISITFSKNDQQFNRDEVAELMKRTQSAVELVLVSDTKDHTYMVKLEEVKLQTGENWELLELKTVRLK
ncbi:hypothetical protein LGR88_13025 [Enterobacter cloacae]|uniref:hypothetical protein n=1 Tax=Enterobacter cloacae TaxID=550 RepID=UPI001F1A51CB|nr:hypothetical protein [Enterobacter cloacae]MCF2229542.1 hypothetical protein [Enterobacter cloacae]MDV5405734.1 hypothetical protein [Enterobacter cloacae]HAS1123220.1 hypothetical protein [Enterobacter cloacae]HAV2175953.1 hypothetical protein [Enterobacter cloacae]